MAQVLGPDIINAIVRTSATQVKLPAGSRITVGGQQYGNTADLFVTTSTTGVSGLDTGALGVHQVWYIHAIVSAGSLALVASLSKTAPTGFTTFTWTGWVFITNDSSQVAQTANSTRWNIQSYTPVSSFTTNTTNEGFWRRIEDCMELNLKTSISAATNAAVYTITIPSGWAIDTTKMPNVGALQRDSVLGVASLFDNAVAGDGEDPSSTYYASSTTLGVSTMQIGAATANGSSPITNTFPTTLGTNGGGGSRIMIRALVPIVGWVANIL